MRDKSKSTPSAPAGDERTGLDAAALARGISSHLRYSLGRLPSAASEHDCYRALALAVRD